MTNLASSHVKTPGLVGCALCGATRVRPLGRNPDFPECRIHRCLDCRYMWTRPEPTPAELREVYRATYRCVRQESPTPDYLAFMDARAEGQYEFITKAASPRCTDWRVLDIGCGAGSLLKVFAAHGAMVTGFEPDVAMAGVARERLSTAARIQNVLFVPEQWRDGPFDLICMSHVLEHVPDPIKFLTGLRKVAKPGGSLFVEVPNETARTVKTICKYEARGLMHLCFFDAGTLHQALTRAGWAPWMNLTCGRDISNWLKTLRRNYSLGGRALRKLGRMLNRAGLVRDRVQPSTFKKGWFTGQNPKGEHLRMVAKCPLPPGASTI